MGDTNVSQELTTFDKISVFFYRGGIVICMFCMIFASIFFFSGDNISFQNSLPKIVFWIFLVSVGVSIFLLHLYSQQILRVMQGFFVVGAIISIIIAFSITSDQFLPYIFTKWPGTIGLGFLLAAFSGIGAKEAFCFKLYEGYIYGILSALIVVIHLIGPFYWERYIFGLITLLVVIFTIRKLRLPLYYDIGDKSKY